MANNNHHHRYKIRSAPIRLTNKQSNIIIDYNNNNQRLSTAPPILANQSQSIKESVQNNSIETSPSIGDNLSTVANDDEHSSVPDIDKNIDDHNDDDNCDKNENEKNKQSSLVIQESSSPIKSVEKNRLKSDRKIGSIVSTSSIMTDRFESLLRRTSFLSTRILNPKALTGNHLLQQEINDHSGAVNCLAISEDLSLLVSGGEDGIILLWSTFSTPCECIGILSGHKNYITCCTVHRYLVISGSADCTLKIWRIEDGNCLMTLYGHEAFINRCCTYGPILMSTSFDNTVRVWSLTDKLTIVQSENQFDHHIDDDDDNNNQLESRGILRRTKISTTFGQCLYVLQDHQKSVTQVAIINFESQNQLLSKGVIQELDIIISTSTDGTAMTYSLATGELRHIFTGHEGPINCLAIDGKESSFVYTAGADSVIKNWDVITGEFVRDLIGHEGSILCLLAQNRILYSGSTDRTVRAWAMDVGQCTRVYYQNTAPVSCLQYFKGILYTGCNDNCARLYDANSAVLMQTFTGHSGLITALQVIPGKLFTSSYDGHILVWDCEELQMKLDTKKLRANNRLITESSSSSSSFGHSMLTEQLRSIVMDSAKTSSLLLSMGKHMNSNNNRQLLKRLNYNYNNNNNNRRRTSTLFSNQLANFFQKTKTINNNDDDDYDQYDDDDGCLPFLSYYCCWPNFLRFISKHKLFSSSSTVSKSEMNLNSNNRQQYRPKQPINNMMMMMNIKGFHRYANGDLDDNDQKCDDSANVCRAINAIEPYLRSFR
ncbi:uncharacterized protein LOC124498987 [Dermatophagoides farinae]|uniref:uncharacterized protein LOC124498987 n=1 Tax=Dermatophagoides farinae TaxID=6954 RepID=UPI003F600F1F